MATIKLNKSEYSNIPEGTQIVRVKKIDDEAYEDYGKLTMILEDKSGNTLKADYKFIDDQGETNDKVVTVFTIASRMLMNDQTLDEVDYTELEGKYAEVEVVHNTGSKGGTFANIKRWTGPASGFDGVAEAPRKRTAAEILAAAKAKRG